MNPPPNPDPLGLRSYRGDSAAQLRALHGDTAETMTRTAAASARRGDHELAGHQRILANYYGAKGRGENPPEPTESIARHAAHTDQMNRELGGEPDPAPAPSASQPRRQRQRATPAPVGAVAGATSTPAAVRTAANGLPHVEPNAARNPNANSDPAYVEAGRRLMADDTFRKQLADAYNHQAEFVEHSDGLVTLPRLYRQMQKVRPDLTQDQFHAALDHLSQNRQSQMHVLNEVREQPNAHNEGSILRNERLYHYVRFQHGRGGPSMADPEQMKPAERGGVNLSSTPEGGGHSPKTKELHAAIALAMVEAQLRKQLGKDEHGDADDIIQWLPELTDPAEAAQAMGAKFLGWVEHGTSGSGKPRWKNTDTGELRYQKSQPGEHTERRRQAGANATRGAEIVGKVAGGTHTREDLQELERHLDSMTVAQLRTARQQLQATFGSAKQRDQMVRALREHVRGRLVPHAEGTPTPAAPPVAPPPPPDTHSHLPRGAEAEANYNRTHQGAGINLTFARTVAGLRQVGATDNDIQNLIDQHAPPPAPPPVVPPPPPPPAVRTPTMPVGASQLLSAQTHTQLDDMRQGTVMPGVVRDGLAQRLLTVGGGTVFDGLANAYGVDRRQYDGQPAPTQARLLAAAVVSHTMGRPIPLGATPQLTTPPPPVVPRPAPPPVQHPFRPIPPSATEPTRPPIPMHAPQAMRWDGNDVEGTAKAVIGDGFSPNDLHTLVSSDVIPGGGSTNVRKSYNGNVEISQTGRNGVSIMRTLRRENGQLVLHNDLFVINRDKLPDGRPDPNGRNGDVPAGADMLARQIDAARRLGVSKIETLAARGGSYNGYITWPKLGYDGPVSAHKLAALPADLKRGMGGKTNVQSLIAQPGGAEWWERNGESIELEFDPHPDSEHSKRLAAYLARPSRGSANRARTTR